MKQKVNDTGKSKSGGFAHSCGNPGWIIRSITESTGKKKILSNEWTDDSNIM